MTQPIQSSEYEQQESFREAMVAHDILQTGCTLTTPEQVRRFELLRLAFFVLKLRKLEHPAIPYDGMKTITDEMAWHGNLLRHAIFQQILTLTQLGARDEAMLLIDTCRKQ